MSAQDDAVADGPQTVTVAASAEGFTGGSDTLEVSDNEVRIEVSFVSEEAGYQNSVGIYDIKTGRAEMLLTNTDTQSNPDAAAFTKTLDVSAGDFANVGYFIIPNGNRLNSWSDVDLENLLVFENSGGAYGVQDADGTILKGTGANAFFSEMAKNPGGFDHVSKQGTEIGFEDLVGGGDQDFNDVVLDVREVALIL